MKKTLSVCYDLCSGVVFDEQEKAHTTYGILALDEHGVVLRRVEDVSLSKERILELIERCNRMRLMLVHLDDVIEDFLCQ